MQRIRPAIDYLKQQYGSEHPLAEHEFSVSGTDLFVQHLDELISLSKPGQLAIRQLLDAYLARIERDKIGQGVRLYLFTRQTDYALQPRLVVMDPLVAFGKPVLAGRGIRTAIIAERYKAGDAASELAEDYGCQVDEIEEAIRCELSLEAA